MADQRWERLAGSLYASVGADGMVSLREWDSPRAPVWRSSRLRILAKIEDATDNVTFGGTPGDAGAVTVQRADLEDLAAFLKRVAT